MSQQFYEDYMRKWREEHQWRLATKIFYDISSSIGLGWEYLTTTFTDEDIARTMAQNKSAFNYRGVPELWRVSRGNTTVALFLNGEEIVEDGN